jgi:tRNA-splicing ligase RtcB
MKMSVLDLPVAHLATKQGRLSKAIEQETRFGVGATFRGRRSHQVMDEDWTGSKVTAEIKDRAWGQLGTSGSGNHFVELGLLTFDQELLGLAPGSYVALLSHSGSRGSGALIAQHFSKLARQLHPELPRELGQLSWLDLDRAEGQEYWYAMQLMGRYAAANHQLIHRHVTGNLGVEVLLEIENHHNFAWREVHLGEELIVHRKGATPAGKDAVGIIPGSMASPAFVVRGKGHPESLDSAAHGAGRRMSRKAAKDRYTWRDVKRVLDKRGVTLLSAGLDEVPMAYKNIEQVMAAQSDLVEAVARFDPKLVKMAPAGERPED